MSAWLSCRQEQGGGQWPRGGPWQHKQHQQAPARGSSGREGVPAGAAQGGLTRVGRALFALGVLKGPSSAVTVALVGMPSPLTLQPVRALQQCVVGVWQMWSSAYRLRRLA